MDLSRLSHASLISILAKTDLRSLTRARKTSSFINTFLEKNRFRCRVSTRKVQLNLEISVEEKEPVENSENTETEFELVFSVAQKCLDYHNVVAWFNDPSNQKYFTKIKDPLRQLANVHFGYIHVVHRHDSGNFSNNIRKLNVLAKLPAILAFLKLRCERLYLNSPIDEMPLKHQIVSLIGCSNITYATKFTCQEIGELPVLKYGTFFFFYFNGVPEEMPPVFLDHSTIVLFFQPHSDIEEVEHLIIRFLTAISEDRRARGCLEYVSFSFENLRKIESFPEMVDIRHGYTRLKKAKISKMKIDGGYAYVYQEFSRFHIQFYDKESDKEALHLFVYHGGMITYRFIAVTISLIVILPPLLWYFFK